MIKQVKTPPFKSKLIPYQKEIFRMWWSRKTLKEIKAYLQKQNVEISEPGLCGFIKRRNKRPDPHYIPDHLKYLMEDDKIKTHGDGTVAKIPTPQEWAIQKAKQKKSNEV